MLRNPFQPRPQVTGVNTIRRLIVYADGAAASHAAGAGIVAHDERGGLRLIANRKLPPMTNNEAEYAGLLLALESIASLRAPSIEIRMDSEIAVNQMRGRFAVNSPALKLLHRQACALASQFTGLTYTCIPREHNRVADALAADALLGHLWQFPL